MVEAILYFQKLILEERERLLPILSPDALATIQILEFIRNHPGCDRTTICQSCGCGAERLHWLLLEFSRYLIQNSQGRVFFRSTVAPRRHRLQRIHNLECYPKSQPAPTPVYPVKHE